jgi:hypothetical protein
MKSTMQYLPLWMREEISPAACTPCHGANLAPPWSPCHCALRLSGGCHPPPTAPNPIEAATLQAAMSSRGEGGRAWALPVASLATARRGAEAKPVTQHISIRFVNLRASPTMAPIGLPIALLGVGVILGSQRRPPKEAFAFWSPINQLGSHAGP